MHLPTIRTATVDRATPAWYRIGLVAAAVATMTTRIGWTLGTGHRTFDDGVYLASVDAMAGGGGPFREVFSSQGPLWLPVLRLADLVGRRAVWAPRLAPLAAGVVVVVLAAEIARRVAGPVAGLVAAGLAATSGALLFTTATLESDSVAAAFAAAAVLAAMASSPRRIAATVGCLGAAALAVKSLVVLPPLVLAWYLLVRAHGWRRATNAASLALAGLVALSIPWGLRDVWDQYVVFHLHAHQGLTAGRNLASVRTRLWRGDRMLVVSGVLTAAWLLLPLSRRRLVPIPSAAATEPHGADAVGVHRGLWIAVVVSVGVLATTSPLQPQHVTLLVLPLAVLIAVHRPPVVLVIAAALLVLPGQAARTAWRLTPSAPTAAEAAMATALKGLVPAWAGVVVDEPGLAWQAGRRIPGPLVDPSFVRLRTRSLSLDDIVDAAEGPGVCLVLFWSGRFATLPDLASHLTGYRVAGRDGAHVAYLREGCRLAHGTGLGAIGSPDRAASEPTPRRTDPRGPQPAARPHPDGGSDPSRAARPSALPADAPRPMKAHVSDHERSQHGWLERLRTGEA